MNRKDFIETTGGIIISCGSLMIAGCLEEEESDGLIISKERQLRNTRSAKSFSQGPSRTKHPRNASEPLSEK